MSFDIILECFIYSSYGGKEAKAGYVRDYKTTQATETL